MIVKNAKREIVCCIYWSMMQYDTIEDGQWFIMIIIVVHLQLVLLILPGIKS